MKLELTIYLKNETYTIDSILGQLIDISSVLSIARDRGDWYLTGSNKEVALRKKIIVAGGRTEQSLELLTRSLQDDLPFVVEKIWNLAGDTLAVRNYTQGDVKNFHYELTCNFDNGELAMEFITNSIDDLIEKTTPRIIHIETNDYSLHESQVFPDRLPVGWIFYINEVHSNDVLNLGKRLIQKLEGDAPVGTIFISKRGAFDGADKQDIQLANDMEILLASHNILPTYDNIF